MKEVIITILFILAMSVLPFYLYILFRFIGEAIVRTINKIKKRGE